MIIGILGFDPDISPVIEDKVTKWISGENSIYHVCGDKIRDQPKDTDRLEFESL